MRLFLVLSLLVGLAGCGGQQQQTSPSRADELAEIKLQLNWFPEVEHGGFYAAKAHDYFKQGCLNVELTPGGPGVNVWAMVDRGRADFGLVNADRVLLARAQGASLKAILAPFQHSPRCILVHAESEIATLADLSDVTLSMNETALFSQFLQKTQPLKNVQIVPYSGSLGPFLVNPQYATQGYVFSEPLIAQQTDVAVRS